jgi:hypothetical protein
LSNCRFPVVPRALAPAFFAPSGRAAGSTLFVTGGDSHTEPEPVRAAGRQGGPGLSARAQGARSHGASPRVVSPLRRSPNAPRLATAERRRQAGDAPWRLPQGAGAQPRPPRPAAHSCYVRTSWFLIRLSAGPTRTRGARG